MSDIFRTFVPVKVHLYIACIVVLGFTACRDAVGEAAVELYGEEAVYRSGDSVLYLCLHEWHNIVLGTDDPHSFVAHVPWRVPTKQEAVVLHQYLVQSDYQQRYLAVDEDGVWWSFLFGSGNITRAGMKTKYTLRPVRWQVAQSDTIIKL